jgi:hypothetical protein
MPLSDEEYKAHLRDRLHQQVEEEGFRIDAYDVESGQTCERGTFEKRRRKWGTAPCGRPAFVSYRVRTPANPDGVEFTLCAGGLSALIKDLMEYLVIAAQQQRP